ncbi:hypothetical protein P152DRAFT_392543, partial [Eremomyces bilateralis CBS 781.70]
GMKNPLVHRNRDSNLSAIPPKPSEAEFSSELAEVASTILYRSPIPSQTGLPIFILNSAAFPDSHEVDYNDLLPYVLDRLPGEDELLQGSGYEVIFFAGGGVETNTSIPKPHRPGWGWFIQAYYVLSRIMRKRLQRLYIVHERSWVRILVEMFSTIVSPKFRRKIYHVSSLTQLALSIPIENLLIPTSAYLHDRRLSPDIYAPYSSGKRAFGARNPLPKSRKGNARFPRVLRETTSFIFMGDNPKTEGIFRVAPYSKVKEIIREAYDRGQKFIIWSENGVTYPVPNYPNAVDAESVISELHPSQCYGVHLAAGLIKNWYSELRQPIVPHGSYGALRQRYSQKPDFLLEDMEELISPASEWSPLPDLSRQILIRHLLPMLAAITEYEPSNKMNAENLSVCFAPSMLCGPDQIEDAKISSVIRRILASAIQFWSQGLREACDISSGQFESDLETPPDVDDYDDPLERPRAGDETPQDYVKQMTGIALRENDGAEEQFAPPPPLPPRPSPQLGSRSTSANVLQRKPTPNLAAPPTYSTIFPVDNDNVAVAQSPTYTGRVADGFGPPRPSDVAQSDSKEPQFGGKEVSVPLPVISLPKRNALTVEQVQNLESDNRNRESGPSASDAARLAREVIATDSARRQSATRVGDESAYPFSSESGGSAVGAGQFQTSAPTFAKPLWPARAGKPPGKPRSPSINSLARPIIPGPVLQGLKYGRPSLQPPQNPGPPVQGIRRVKSPSAGLLKRIHSAPQEPDSSAKEQRRQAVGRLDLRKQSVDDLRRLYEERAATAQALTDTVPAKERLQ